MQIISGACLFVIATILLAYMPGKLLLMAFKRTLSPLEDVTLACFLGLVVSGLAYWLITYAHETRFFFLWPIGTGALFVWLYASKTKVWRDSPKPGSLSTEGAVVLGDRSGVALAGVIALGIIVLAFLPFYYANLTARADGTMYAYPVPDVVLHIAIANELTHTIPPQAPHFLQFPRSACHAVVPRRFPVTIGHMKKSIFTSEAPAAIGPYSQAVRAGRFLFCSSLFRCSVFFAFRGIGFSRDISALSSCSWCFLAKTSPSFPDSYGAKTLTGPFGTSVCRQRFCLSSIRIQSSLDWVSFLRGCFVSSATCRSAAGHGFSLLRCCLSL